MTTLLLGVLLAAPASALPPQAKLIEATGRVTQKVPAPFPTADTVSYRADIAAMDPSYRNGLDSLTAPRR